jgi:flagellar biosynthesis/type III secretory pathway protein FliH
VEVISLASVLRAPTLGASQVLRFSQTLPPDPEWEQRLAEADIQSYSRGVEEGRRQAVDELAGQLDSLRATVLDAVDRAAAEVRAQVQADTEQVVALALELAESVTGPVPVTATLLTERIHASLDTLEGAHFVVEVHAEDLDFVTGALDDPRCTVRSGSRLQPGEARVRSEWGHAELTRDVAWTVLREAFDAD